jgi:hypothetical protein
VNTPLTVELPGLVIDRARAVPDHLFGPLVVTVPSACRQQSCPREALPSSLTFGVGQGRPGAWTIMAGFLRMIIGPGGP